MKRLFGYMLISGVILGQWAFGSSNEPNAAAAEPNLMAFLLSAPDPNSNSASESQPIPGTLATNWLFQGKQPPQPLVGQEDITFKTGIEPWPYIGLHNDDDIYARPWFYNPGYRYGCWRYYSNEYWRYHRHDDLWRHLDDFTYPLHYVDVEMKINENMSFHLGASFMYDPLYWP